MSVPFKSAIINNPTLALIMSVPFKSAPSSHLAVGEAAVDERKVVPAGPHLLLPRPSQMLGRPSLQRLVQLTCHNLGVGDGAGKDEAMVMMMR